MKQLSIFDTIPSPNEKHAAPPRKVYCLFEQSGTFKKEFMKLGIPAEDYDIGNEFGETDHQMDVFAEIDAAYEGRASIFDGIGEKDLIMAFFPCIRFSTNIQMGFRGESPQQQNWGDERKLLYSMELHDELARLYTLISKLALVAIRRRLQLIIENPYTQPHYLTMFWPLRPAIIDRDRTERGDIYKKPTQYFFINREPNKNYINDDMGKQRALRNNDAPKGIARSMIAPRYAERFIKEFIL